jgi:hypothetical protein
MPRSYDELDMVEETITIRRLVRTDREKALRMFEHTQTAVFVMAGGGLLGRFASEQPADFYIDDRKGRLPYSNQAVVQAVELLTRFAEALDLDPHRLPERMAFHNLGSF